MLMRPRWPLSLPAFLRLMAGTKPSTGMPVRASRSSGVFTVSSMYSARKAAPRPSSMPSRMERMLARTLRGLTGTLGGSAASATSTFVLV